MPVQGKHNVLIGSSLKRALKARKGGVPPPKNGKLPHKDFYSFRYNFKPESVDATKPGSIEVKKGREATTVSVERASTQTGEGHVFVGQEHPAREWDCVLIYDEDINAFTLEKLDSYVALTYDRKTFHAPRPAASPASPAPSIASASTPSHQRPQSPLSRVPRSESQDDLPGVRRNARGEPNDRTLPTASAKAKGKGPPSRPPTTTAAPSNKAASVPERRRITLAERKALAVAVRKEEEEESSGGEGGSKLAQKTEPKQRASDVQTKAPPRSPSPLALPGSGPAPTLQPPLEKPRSSQASSAPSGVYAPTAKAKVTGIVGGASNSSKRALPTDVEEETLEWGRPSQPAKRPRASPPPVKGSGKETSVLDLALPSSSSQMPSLPKEPSGLAFPSATSVVTLPSAPAAAADSDEEDDWVPVTEPAAPPPVAAPMPVRQIDMEEIIPEAATPVEYADADADENEDDMEEMEIDVNAFQAELDKQLYTGASQYGEGEDDDLEAVISPETERPPGGVFDGATGADWDDDDDDTSSDEDSD